MRVCCIRGWTIGELDNLCMPYRSACVPGRCVGRGSIFLRGCSCLICGCCGWCADRTDRGMECYISLGLVEHFSFTLRRRTAGGLPLDVDGIGQNWLVGVG